MPQHACRVLVVDLLRCLGAEDGTHLGSPALMLGTITYRRPVSMTAGGLVAHSVADSLNGDAVMAH